jgi:hypothetical protein
LVFITPTEERDVWTTSICSRTAPLESERARRNLEYFRSLSKPGDHGVIWGLFFYGDPGGFDGPATGIRVRLAGAGRANETVTDQNGVFDFSELPKGHYTLDVSASQDSKREVEVGAYGCESADFLLPRKLKGDRQ